MLTEIMKILFHIHSDLRWLILLFAVIIIVKFAIGWLGKKEFTKADKGLFSALLGSMDLQATLGIVFLIWNTAIGADLTRERLEHAGTMIFAVVLAHLSAKWKTAPDAIRFRNLLFITLGVLALIYLGVASLPNGWTR